MQPTWTGKLMDAGWNWEDSNGWGISYSSWELCKSAMSFLAGPSVKLWVLRHFMQSRSTRCTFPEMPEWLFLQNYTFYYYRKVVIIYSECGIASPSFASV